MHRIYKLTERAINLELDWDDAILSGEIETVAEFDSYEAAVTEYMEDDYDVDLYGVE